MRDLFRVASTAFVWVVFTIFMFGLFAMANDTYESFYFLFSTAITATLALFAFMLTSRIWQRRETPEPPARNTTRTRSTASKNTKVKRDHAARVEALMDRLDEDDIIELETLLAAREIDMRG
jgi:hypothetical protein